MADSYSIITRSEASQVGAKRYFTGSPCRQGHIAERRTTTGFCVLCERAAVRNKRQQIALIKAQVSHQRSEQLEVATTASNRAEAVASGQSSYFTGKACARGHVALRDTSAGGCKACAQENQRKDSAVAKRKVSHKAHYEKTRDAKLAYGKEYREKNKGKFTVWMQEWRAKNPERDRATRRASQAKRRAGGDGTSTAEMRLWVSVQKKKCHWCGVDCPGDFHVDHYEPLSKGGAHEVCNFVIACPSCNLKKSAKDPYEFAQSVGRLF